jgi:hypothetical protein
MFQLLINIMPLILIKKIKNVNNKKINIFKNWKANTNVDYFLYLETIDNKGFQKTDDV